MTEWLVVGGCRLGHAGLDNTDSGHTLERLQNMRMAVEPWSKYNNVEPNNYAVVKRLLLTVMPLQESSTPPGTSPLNMSAIGSQTDGVT